jgi:hypothetical protein
MINYNTKSFRPINNTLETTFETTFIYFQNGNILTCEYSGGKIIKGHLIGLVDEDGKFAAISSGK